MRGCADSGSTKKHAKRREEFDDGARDTNPAWVSHTRGQANGTIGRDYQVKGGCQGRRLEQKSSGDQIIG